MANWESTGEWKQVELSAVEVVGGTTQVYQLPKKQWPKWANSSLQMNRLWICTSNPDSRFQEIREKTNIVAYLITERSDAKDDLPFNFNVYLIAESTDGRLYQSPPIPTIDPAHHSSGASTWLENCDPPPNI